MGRGEPDRSASLSPFGAEEKQDSATQSANENPVPVSKALLLLQQCTQEGDRAVLTLLS